MSVWLQGPELLPLTVIGFLTDWLFSGKILVPLALLGVALLAWQRRWSLAASLLVFFPLVAAGAGLKYVLPTPAAATFLKVRVLFVSSFGGPQFLANGYPSGHAARTAFALGWLVLAFAPSPGRLRAAVFAIVLTCCVGWTRIYVGDHTLLEILGGLALALVFLIPAAILQTVRPGGSRGPTERLPGGLQDGQEGVGLQGGAPNQGAV